MAFFDFDDEETSSVLSTQPPPGPMPVDMSGQGSMMPGVAGKRGKKTRIPIHRIRPHTSLDKGKLEALGKGGDPSIEDLEKWGISYDVGPESAGKGGVGVVPEAALKTPRDSNAIQGDISDITRPLGKAASAAGGAIHKAATALTPNFRSMDQERFDQRLAGNKELADRKVRDEVGAMQKGEGLNLPPTPDPKEDTVIGAAEAAGVPENDFLKSIAEAAKTLGLDMNQPVQFPLALQRLLGSDLFAEVRPDFEALGQSAQASATKPSPQTEEQMAGGGEKKPAKPEEPDTKALHADALGILTKFAQARDISTWGEAIAFVLLSMLIKPQMAILFFSRAAERGTLKAQYGDIQKKIAMLEQESKIRSDRNEWNRREAAGVMMKGQEEQWQRERDKRKFVQEWFLLQQKAAMTKPKAPTADPVARALQKDMDNWLGLAAKYGQDWANPEAQRKAQDAMTKAAAVHQTLRKYVGLPEFEEEGE